MNKTTLDKFKLIYLVEGISYLILLFIAMPLKYMAGIAIATKIAGMLHGILFIFFLIMLSQAMQKYKFGTKLSVILFVSSLIPFANFFVNKKLDEFNDKS